MEQIIAGVIEKSLVGGAFLWLLYQYTTIITKSVNQIATTLAKVSSTMTSMDKRMAQVEKDIEELKGVNK